MLRRLICAAVVSLPVPIALAAQGADSAARLVARADSLAANNAAEALQLVKRALPALAAPGDSVIRRRAFRIRCWAAAEAQPDSLSAWADAGVAIATQSHDSIALAYLTVCRGYARENAGDELGALRDYEAGVTAGRTFAARDLLADALVLRGEMEYSRGDFRSSVQDLDEAYRLYAALGQPARVRYTLNAMANLYADPRMAQYDRALQYYRQILAENAAENNQREVATAYFNIGSTLEQMNRLDESLVEYRRGLAMDVQRGDAAEVATDRRAVGVVLYKLGRPGDALRELQPSLAYYQRIADTAGIARGRLSRGIAFRMLGRTSEAIADLDVAGVQFRATGNRRFLEKTDDERAIAYAAAGRWHDAYVARVEQLDLRRSLEAEAREEQSARLRAQFESEKQEQDNRALARENARVRRLQLAVIGLAAIIILALGVLAGRQWLAGRRLRMLAMVDELTQVPNRRAIMQLADDSARTARGGGPGFALLALDVDHFKPINDRFGHEAGDRVLRRVADACRLALRPGDYVGRTGGEEFLVILPGAPAQAAREVAERLRASVAQSDYADVGPDLTVTLSIGAAVWGGADRSAADVLHRADASLYDVKRSGRNQVLVAS